uniref:Transmembrane protein n=1 Tax=Macrostomum lignano TaxID=282301 RepID=A0A1I8IQG2_9PLAT
CLENFDRPAAAGRGGSSCALKASQRVSLQPPARHRARGRGWRFAGEVNRKCKAARPEVRLGSNICRVRDFGFCSRFLIGRFLTACVKRGVEGDPPAQRSSALAAGPWWPDWQALRRGFHARPWTTAAEPELPDALRKPGSLKLGAFEFRDPTAKTGTLWQLSVSWLYLLLLLLLLRDCRKEAFRSSGPRRGSEVHQAAQAGISSERIAKGLSSHPRHPSALPLGLQRLQ